MDRQTDGRAHDHGQDHGGHVLHQADGAHAYSRGAHAENQIELSGEFLGHFLAENGPQQTAQGY